MSAPPHEAIADAIAHLPAQRVAPPTWPRPRWDPGAISTRDLLAYWVARHHRFKRDLETLPAGVEAIVLPTGATPSLRYNDFTRSGELLDTAYAASDRFLDGETDEAAPLPAGDRPQGSAETEVAR